MKEKQKQLCLRINPMEKNLDHCGYLLQIETKKLEQGTGGLKVIHIKTFFPIVIFLNK